MRVLVACEYSCVVRDAFAARGHDAVSCDLLPSETDHGRHHKGSVLEILNDGWDLMIAHPPCQHLAVSGARWFPQKQVEQRDALNFVRELHPSPQTGPVQRTVATRSRRDQENGTLAERIAAATAVERRQRTIRPDSGTATGAGSLAQTVAHTRRDRRRHGGSVGD